MTKRKPKIRTPEFMLTYRASGVKELTCEHGVGHPIVVPAGKEKNDSWWVHGCDGCCGTEPFKEAKDKNLSILFKKNVGGKK